MDFSKLNFGVDGDSITAGEQWSHYVYKELGMASHHNVAVGSAVWYKRTIECASGKVTTQNYTDSDFAGISDGWEETDDINELQKRVNNCAVVHTQRFIEEVKSGNILFPMFSPLQWVQTTLITVWETPKRLLKENPLKIMTALMFSPRQVRQDGAYSV